MVRVWREYVTFVLLFCYSEIQSNKSNKNATQYD